MVKEGRYGVIPLRAGVSLGGRHIGVTSGAVGHKSVRPASICGAPEEEDQQGVVCNRLPSHLEPVVAVQLPAQRGGKVPEEHEEQGSWNSTQDRTSLYVGPPFCKCATSSRVPPSSGGSHRTVAASQPHVHISAARSMLVVWSMRRGG